MPPLRFEQSILPFPESPKPIPIAWVMVTGIINNKLSVLAARRTGSNKLTFPGGKVELGEDGEDAAVRETLEESGIVLGDDTFFLLSPLPPYFSAEPLTRTFCTQGKEYIVDPYLLMLDNISDQKPKNLQPKKNGEWSWFTVKELINEMMQGNLPSFILEDWLNWSIDGLYEIAFPEPFHKGKIPAWFMEECAEIAEEARRDKFKNQLLR